MPNSYSDNTRQLAAAILAAKVKRAKALSALPAWQPKSQAQDMALRSQAHELLYGGAAGGGKALALDTPLFTTTGWTTMGDIRIGDVVFSDTGEPTTVVAASPVMYDHEVYQVVFDDGTIITADAEHKWLTETVASRSSDTRTHNLPKHPRPQKRTEHAVRTTVEIADTVWHKGRVNHSIPLAQPLQLSHAENLLIHPYVLGVWLGDGNSHGQGLTCADQEIIETITALGYTVVPWAGQYSYGIKGVKRSLRKYGLLGDKHIPTQYLLASEQQRWQLLYGLMDTDGTALPSGACEFYNTNKRLAQQVYDLLLSLGLKPHLSEGTSTLYGHDYGPKYRIKFTTSRHVFWLKRKYAQQVRKERGVQRRRYIVRVVPVPSVPVRCIAVDAPSHLYLASRALVPTHNTDLILGAAATTHRKSIIFRRQFPQLRDIILRSSTIYKAKWPSAQYNKTDHLWQLPNQRTVEFGSMPYLDDREKYQGRAHDLKAWDEITQFLLEQYVYVNAWTRSTIPNQLTRNICTGNPPMNAEGEWVISYWGPWLDDQYRDSPKAAPGELRWFATIKGEQIEVENGKPFKHQGASIEPRSRTFIPARFTDNPYLRNTGYAAVLSSLPEPLRSLLLHGFDARVRPATDPWQLIPAEWIDAANERYRQHYAHTLLTRSLPITALGHDVSRGGSDRTVVAILRNNVYDPLLVQRGEDTPDGESAARLAIRALGLDPDALTSAEVHSPQGQIPINVDIIGPGSSSFDVLRKYGFNAFAVHGNASSSFTIREQTLETTNLRAEMYWRLREALDPAYGNGLALPPDRELRGELMAVKWGVNSQGRIQVEDKPTIARKLGRSPDKADAVAMAQLDLALSTEPVAPLSTSTRQYVPTATQPPYYDAAIRETQAGNSVFVPGYGNMSLQEAEELAHKFDPSGAIHFRRK